MPYLKDYLEITPEAAGQQWSRILARPPRPTATRARQEPFTPVETLLCLAASLNVNHRRFGGSTSHQAPTPVPELAGVFRRTPASILAKMANLDGSRTNGARHEVETAAALLSDPPRLSAVYVMILAAGREAGVTTGRLPDFLGLADHPLDLLGQDELTEADLHASLPTRTSTRDGADDLVTSTLLLSAARIGQHRFARDVLANCGHRCVFCGLTPGVALARRHLLRASHIKPWRSSTGRERLDIANGLAACPTHDAAFDTGLLYVADDLQICVSPKLATAVDEQPGMAAAFGRPPLADTLLLPATAIQPRPTYLDWHRRNIAS